MARLLKAGVCVLLCFIKSHFPFQIAQMVATKVFNKTSSVYQTPVERQWLDTNLVTRKFKEHFRIIEAMGEFSSDSNSDIFSLTSVYMPELVSDVNAHYEAMRYCKKKVTTTNPDYPKGTSTRLHLYQDYGSMKLPMTASEIESVAQVGDAYWAGQHESPSPWEIDPLTRQEDRDTRSEAIRLLQPLQLYEVYSAHRKLTQILLAGAD